MLISTTFGDLTHVAVAQGYVDVLAAQQTTTEKDWYKGSADAVRRNLPMILEPFRGATLPDELLVLSGHALYRMVRVQESRMQAWCAGVCHHECLDKD